VLAHSAQESGARRCIGQWTEENCVAMLMRYEASHKLSEYGRAIAGAKGRIAYGLREVGADDPGEPQADGSEAETINAHGDDANEPACAAKYEHAGITVRAVVVPPYSAPVVCMVDRRCEYLDKPIPLRLKVRRGGEGVETFAGERRVVARAIGRGNR